MQIKCKSLPEEWTAGGRLSDVSVQVRTTALGRNGEEKEHGRPRGKSRSVENGAGALSAAVEKCL